MASVALFLNFVALLLWFSSSAQAQSDTSLWTSWIPLAVRTPYLSTWMNTTNAPFNTSSVDGVLRAPTIWPQFLQGQINGWIGLVRIDETQTFVWLGDPVFGPGLHRTVLTNIQVTPTRTILNITAGPLDLTVTFLSPIEPMDPVLQSLAFSYVSLEATSNDGQQHDVQVYSDISGEWLSGDRTQFMNWVTQSTADIVYHQLDLEDPQSLTEIQNQAQDATVFYAMAAIPAQTFMVDTDVNCRGLFQHRGILTNKIINGPRRISSPFPVFAISVNLGHISETPEPIVWAIGMNRNPSIGYVSADGTTQQRSPYWASNFTTIQDAMSFLIQNYQGTLNRAVAFDDTIMAAASNLSAHYADLVSLASRQAMGGTELTIVESPSDPTGWNTSDVKMFMKDVGTSGRVNPVEGLYASLPFFLYMNATYVGWLLEPVLEFASSSRWSFPYAPRDIGTGYPNAAGDSSSHSQGVEQSGNMLIMTLAHARATGDGSLIARYYTLLKAWAEYLVNETLPLDKSQTSADVTDTQGSLANLALKGVIGVRAMSEISAAMGITNDTDRYSTISSSLAAQWQAQAVSSDGQHFVTSLNAPNSSLALTYNLFADKLLNTNLIPSALYVSHTTALNSSISTTNDGLPVDGGLSGEANAVWSLFAAGYTDDLGVQQRIVDQIWTRVSNNATDTGIFATNYDLSGSNASISTASPFIGGIFAPLALNMPNVTINIPTTPSTPSAPNTASASSAPVPPKKTNRVAAIAGGVIGGLAGIALLALIACILWRKRHARTLFTEPDDNDMPAKLDPFPYEVTPDEHSPESAPAPPTSPRPLQILSAKAREANARIFRRPPPSFSAYSSTTSRGAFSYNPPTELSVNRLSRSELRGLRAEVENLRRAIQSMRPARHTYPPGQGQGQQVADVETQ